MDDNRMKTRKPKGGHHRRPYISLGRGREGGK
jgi:hypothetical protein